MVDTITHSIDQAGQSDRTDTVSETERAVAEELFSALPALETYLGSRAAYIRMDKEGLLGVIADKTLNRALAAHVQNAMKEAGDLLDEIDQLILAPAEVA
jgi:chromosome partitioning protein